MTLLHFLGLPPRIQSRYIHGIERSTPERILKAVESVTSVTMDCLKSASRKAPLPDIRAIAMHLIRKHTHLTLAETGAIFNRKHATVMNAISKANDLLETDTKFERLYNKISKEI